MRFDLTKTICGGLYGIHFRDKTVCLCVNEGGKFAAFNLWLGKLTGIYVGVYKMSVVANVVFHGRLGKGK